LYISEVWGVNEERERSKNSMRKVFLNMMMSLDGFVAGPNDEMDWCTECHQCLLIPNFNCFYYGKEMASLISYDDIIHREQFFELNVNYLTYLRDAAIKNIGSTFLKNPREYVERGFPKFASIKPPKRIIYLLWLRIKRLAWGHLLPYADYRYIYSA